MPMGVEITISARKPFAESNLTNAFIRYLQRKSRIYSWMITFLLGIFSSSNAQAQTGLTLEMVRPDASYTYLVAKKDGQVEIVTGPMTQDAGGRWSVTKQFGEGGLQGKSESAFEIKIENGSVVAELSHTVECEDPAVEAETNGLATFGVRLVGGEELPPSALILVDIYRTIIPASGVSGFSKIDDTKIEIDQQPWMQREQYVYEVDAGTLIPVPSLSGEITVSGKGTIYATSTVVVSMVGEVNSSPMLLVTDPADTDDPADDEVDPDSDCGEGADVGDALHMRLTTGNVWTRIPVFTSYANSEPEFDFELRYDTLRAHENGPLGYGWTHSCNLSLTEQVDSGITKFIFRTGNGRRNAFTSVRGNNYVTPPGRSMVFTKPAGSPPSILYPDGAAYSFDTSNRLGRIVDRRGRTTRFNYSSGRLSSVVSPYGRTITFVYYAAAPNRLWKIIDPDQKVTEFTYDAQTGDLKTITDPLGGVVQYDYDASHRITKETLKNNKFYTAAYDNDSPRLIDSQSNVIAQVSGIAFPLRNSDTFSSGLVTYTDGRGKVWTVTRDNLGRFRGLQAPNTGPSQTYDYGGPNAGANRNRRIKSVNELGYETLTKWDAFGNIIERTDPELNVEKFEFTHTRFHHLVTRHIEPDQDAWDFKYDAFNGDLQTITDPIIESTVPGQDKIISFSYETHPAGSNPSLPGRVKKVTRTNRNGHQSVREYDLTGNLVTLTRGAGSLNLVTTYQFDANGRERFETTQRGDAQVVREFTWDAMGRLIDTVEDSAQNGLSLTTHRAYDLHGNLLSITNPRGYKTSYGHDHRNRVVEEIVDDNAGGLELTSQWQPDGNGNITSYTDPNNHVTHFIYNDQNHLTETQDAEDYRTFFDRDEAGRLERVDRALTPGASPTQLRSASFTYDVLNRVRTETVAPDTLGLTTQIEYNSPSGCSCNPATPGESLPHKIIDPKGKVTFLNYDDLDRLTSTVRKVGSQHDTPLGDTDDAITTYEYDPTGNLIEIHEPEGQSALFEYDAAERRFSRTIVDTIHGSQTTLYAHDGADNVRQVTLPNGNVITVAYDMADRMTSAIDTLGAIVSYQYDANGNVEKRFDGLQHFWEYTYDPADRLSQARDPIIESPDKYASYAYDNAGNLTSETNNRGIVTRYSYDDIDRLIEKTEDFRSPANPAIPTDNTRTLYGFDGLNQVSIADHDGNTTGYEYDDALRVSKVNYPSPGGSIEYDYDAAGNLYSRLDQRGILTLYEYNDLHNLTERVYPSRTEEFTFDRSDRLRRAKNDLVESTFTYDEADRLETAVQAYLVDPATYTTTFDYVVAANDVRRITHYPAGRTATHQLDQRLRVASATAGSGVGATWSHDLADRRTGAALGNGINSTFEHDINDRLTKVKHAKDTTALFDIDYGYDENGNRLWKRFNAAATNDLTDRSEVYTYDNRDRLTAMARGTMATGTATIATPLNHATLARNQQWQNLDHCANWREFRQLVGASSDVTQTRLPNEVNQYTQIDLDGSGSQSAVSPQHDAAGNLTTDPTARAFDATAGGQKYVYDEENRLTAVRRASNHALIMEIKYDAIGRRIETIQHIDPTVWEPLTGPRHTRHIYDGLETIEEYVCGTGVPACESDWDIMREFVWGARFPEPVAMIAHDVGAPMGGNDPY